MSDLEALCDGDREGVRVLRGPRLRRSFVAEKVDEVAEAHDEVDVEGPVESKKREHGGSGRESADALARDDLEPDGVAGRRARRVDLGRLPDQLPEEERVPRPPGP